MTRDVNSVSIDNNITGINNDTYPTQSCIPPWKTPGFQNVLCDSSYRTYGNRYIATNIMKLHTTMKPR
jgi:hypothetical protein